MSRLAVSFGACLLAGLSELAWGSGFAIGGKSTSNVGSAFSGTAANAEDATVIFNNPALMQYLEHDQISVALQAIIPGVKFDNEGSTTNGSATTGTESEHIDTLHFIPNVSYVKKLNEDAHFGIGIYSPFGLGLDYDKDWVGRYHTTESQLRTINISPAFSFSAGEKMSLGIGVDFQYASAELSNAMDYGAFLGGAYQQYDGSQTLSGHDWAMGYSLGLSYDFSKATRMGISFHSATRHDFNGTSEFDNVPGPLTSVFNDTDASLTLMLPENLNIGVRHAATPRLNLLANYTWTRWSRYDKLVVEFDNSLPDSVIEQNWRDASRYSVGMNYRWRDDWLIRAGASYDETPVPDAKHRSPRTPDTSKVTLGIGSRFDLSDAFSLDMAVAYTLPSRADIDNTDNLGHELKGHYKVDSSYISAQLNWKL